MSKTEMKKVQTALRLRFENGLSQSKIAKILGIARSTIQECWLRFDRTELSWEQDVTTQIFH